MGNMVTQSMDGRFTWELDTTTGVLTGMLANGWKLRMNAEDTRRLKQLLVEYSDVLDREGEKVLHRLGEYHKPLV